MKLIASFETGILDGNYGVYLVITLAISYSELAENGT